MAVIGYVTVLISAADMLACSQKRAARIEHDIHNSGACFHVLRYMKTKALHVRWWVDEMDEAFVHFN